MELGQKRFNTTIYTFEEYIREVEQTSITNFFSHIPGLIPKSLRSTFDVKTYVLLLIVISPSNGDFKSGGALRALRIE